MDNAETVSYDSDESKDERKVESNSKNVLEGEDFKKLQKRVNKITVFVWGKNTIPKFVGNTE